MQWIQLYAQIEAILFASGEAIEAKRLAEALACGVEEIHEACLALMEDYRASGRGLCLVRLEESYQLLTAPEYEPLIRGILGKRRPERLSRAALEVLSVVAYYQPVTKSYVEQIRGVDSAYTMGLLLDRELIEDCGRLDVPGRPILYRTTQGFLRVFGLSTLDELPALPPVPEEEKGSEDA